MNKKRSKEIFDYLISNYVTKKGNLKVSTKKRNNKINRYSWDKDDSLVFENDFFDATEVGDIEHSYLRSDMKTVCMLLPDTELHIKTYDGKFIISTWEEAKNLTFSDLGNKKYDRDDNLFCTVSYKENRINSKMIKNTCKELIKYSIEIFNSYAENIHKNNVYIVEAQDWNYVVHDFKAVAAGAWHDFHSGCCGLTEYNGIELGDDWNGAGSLAQMIAIGSSTKNKKSKVFRIEPKEEEKRFLDILF